MGYHEQCVKCKGDMCTEVDRGETCRDCLKKRIEELEAENNAACRLVVNVTDDFHQARAECKHLKDDISAMKDVVDAAMEWKDLHTQRGWSVSEVKLRDAVDAQDKEKQA